MVAKIGRMVGTAVVVTMPATQGWPSAASITTAASVRIKAQNPKACPRLVIAAQSLGS
ncbi:hypothetical protein OG455_21275 [Kitasatospora sp. NBC_01287]|uniref:hypothetical protein n=1 Tax=Kitasatospora sp. NBC_01287 TaxID=2903573 RepID=UPI0022557935|nr:hypothetical protein [Kitasatospora sp. NBC_01287]MCX4748015.1 hypothetical protein [Kitasatospora sp. NBC_01287]